MTVSEYGDKTVFTHKGETAMLTALSIDRLTAGEKDRIVADGDGLCLIVRKSGRKTWLVRVWIDGKEKRITLGDYPAITLSTARIQRDEIKSRIRSGMPALGGLDKVPFATVAREWLALKTSQWVPKYAQTVTYRVEHYLIPALGTVSIGTITRQRATDFLLTLARRGTIVTARRCGEILTSIADYAIERGYIDHHPLQNLTRVLPTHTPEHFEHATRPEDFGALLNAIDGITSPITRAALQITALCFVRVGELLAARWSEIDLDTALWIIPADHTKRKREHAVPLARQAVAVLCQLKEYERIHVYSGRDDLSKLFVFPAQRPRTSANTPITEAAMLKALKVLCWEAAKEGRVIPATTVHGFRHTASTLLHGMGENTLWIEKQLAHLDPNKIRAVYNSYEFLDERRGMMQRYADYLDALKANMPEPSKPQI